MNGMPKNIEEVKNLKSALHKVFDSREGKDVMEFLEGACGWYGSIFDPAHRDLALVNDGKRQVIGTIKTILKLPAEQILAYIKEKEEL